MCNSNGFLNTYKSLKNSAGTDLYGTQTTLYFCMAQYLFLPLYCMCRTIWHMHDGPSLMVLHEICIVMPFKTENSIEFLSELLTVYQT